MMNRLRGSFPALPTDQRISAWRVEMENMEWGIFFYLRGEVTASILGFKTEEEAKEWSDVDSLDEGETFVVRQVTPEDLLE
jgi:hypothetical protein